MAVLPSINLSYKVYRIPVTLISLVILAAFTVYVFYLSFRSYSLFSWHPSFMTIGFVFLMAEAITVMSKESVFSLLHFSHNQSVRQHWILNVIAAISIIIGMLSIIISKNNSHHSHFVSWHAVFGLIAVVLCGITCGEGLVTLYSTKFKHWLRPSIVKFIHACLGILVFSFGLIAELTGLYTHFFLHATNSNVQIACALLVLFASIFVLEGAIKTAYSRFKNIMED